MQQGCSVVLLASAPGEHSRVLTSVLGRLENLSFYMEIICWEPWISQLQSIELLRIFPIQNPYSLTRFQRH